MRLRTYGQSAKKLVNRFTLGIAGLAVAGIMSLGMGGSASALSPHPHAKPQIPGNGYGGICTNHSCNVNIIIDIDIIVVGNGNTIIIFPPMM